MIVGYARVSTDEPTLDAQQAKKISGVITDRRELRRAIDSLNSGDVLLVTKLDRLAR